MQIQDIRKRAEALGIQNLPKAKAELIRAIQLQEGNFDCYGSVRAGFCDQTQCLWYSDCMGEATAARQEDSTAGKQQDSSTERLSSSRKRKQCAGARPADPVKAANVQKAKPSKAGIKGKRR